MSSKDKPKSEESPKPSEEAKRAQGAKEEAKEAEEAAKEAGEARVSEPEADGAKAEASKEPASEEEGPAHPAFRERSTLPEYAGVTARGVLMGAADVIPGVSGGTMALIVGIYEELVASIRAFGVEAIKLLLKGRIAAFSRQINLPFLLALVLGIGAAIVSLARVMPKLLRTYPAPVKGLFFGLILASIVIVWRQIEEHNAQNIILGLLAALGAYWLVGLIPVQTPNHLWFIFLCGAIAICAMILPGLSGAFLLLLMGKYAYILDALYQVTRHRKLDHHLLIVLVFIAGCACGIMAFSRVLHWLLEKHHAPTLAALTGLMLGSLRKIWPFQTASGEEMLGAKYIISNYMWPFEKDVMAVIDKKGLYIQNTWPASWDAQSLLALVLVAFGIVFVFSIDRIAQKRNS